MNGRTFSFRRQITNATADRPLLQLKAPTNTSLAVIRAWLSQSSSETSLQTAVRLARKSAAATVTAAVIADDVRPLDGDDAASTVAVGTSATGYNASTTGTTATGGILHQEGFNVVGSGWLWLPTPPEYIIVPADGILALEPVESLTMTLECGLVFIEF